MMIILHIYLLLKYFIYLIKNVILDFTRSSSIDSTAFIAFVELCEKLTSLDVFVGFVVIKDSTRQRLDTMVRRSSAKADSFKVF